ncbi:unnamed protein product [Lactuca saligna]|uniref:Uncharacterized protein n=1 Tax=Lactuca saligna TaxID=75948 RepID=A0AA36EKP3_LACSI|nr:unnamed protein product [Lactuca saligna]
MTCVDEHEFGMGYLETMRVVRNFGSHWGIVPSDVEGVNDDEEPADQPAPEPRPRRGNPDLQTLQSVASSRPGSPICGGHLVTRLARSYHLVVPDITRSMTCVDEHEFGMGYLETMRVVRNFGSHWGIVPSDAEGVDDDEELADQPASEPRPRHGNVRGRGDRGQPIHPPASMVGTPFGSDMAGYFDHLSLSVNWIGGTV